jgi:hypothetical protein
VFDRHERRADAHDHRFGVGEDFIGGALRAFPVRNDDPDLAYSPRFEARRAELVQQAIAIRDPRGFDLNVRPDLLAQRLDWDGVRDLRWRRFAAAGCA